MIIGIDASRAFIKQRTGIEEYSYQVIKHLRHDLEKAQVILYIRKNQKIDFDLPRTWRVKKLWSPRLWTQIRLSLELFFHPVNVLFVPAHTVPIIHPARNSSLFDLALIFQKLIQDCGISTRYNQHGDAGGPKKTIVTVHGLEYEFVPDAYSWWEKIYMRTSIKSSCRWASRIIAVSKNTKQDLVNLYKVPEEKIEVVYEGYDPIGKSQIPNPKSQINTKYQILNTKYLLFIGRLEERKNISGIIEAFEILKIKYKIPHKLILAGKEGYGYENIIRRIKGQSSQPKAGPPRAEKFSQDIILPGYVSEEEKWELLKRAEVFLFPSFYEGFGLPILEAQSAGVPVVAANTSSIPEIADGSVLLADPDSPEFMAKLAYDLISDAELRDGIIKKGYENLQRFNWDKCAGEIAQIIQISE